MSRSRADSVAVNRQGNTNLMDFNTATDEELLSAIGAQDVSALEEFFDRHHRLALAVANRVLRDPARSEDVVQEAFLAVWRQASSFNKKKGKARTWLLSVVRHRAIDVTRGKGYSTPVTSLEELTVHPETDDVWPDVNRNIDAQILREAMNSLPDEQREAISMAYFEGYTNREVAEATDVPLGTVKGRIRLGMNKLREIVVPQLEPAQEDSD